MHSPQPLSRARWQFSPGQQLPPWQVLAHNDATDSRNPMHDDARAKQLGFAGGLVPGVTLYGYLTHPLLALLGQSFLERSSFDVRFRRPVYEGEVVTTQVRIIESGDDFCSFELELRNPAGEACVIGSARYPVPPRDTPPVPAVAALPVARRPATPEELHGNRQLGTLHEIFTRTQSEKFLASMGEDLCIYQSLVHPAWLLRQANYVVDRNLAVGPWIHVASEIQHLGVVHLDEPYAVHGKVVELTERKGNDYADIDVVIVTTRPVMRVLHKAIYRMAAAG